MPTVFARQVLPVLAVAALALVAWLLADVLLLLFGGIICATALRAIAAPLESRAHLSPRLATTMAVLVTALLVALGAWLIGDRLIAELGKLRERLPEALAALTAWLNSHSIGAPLLDLWDDLKQGSVPWARVANLATLTIGTIASVALIAVLGIYLAASPRMYHDGLVRLVPPHYRQRIDETLRASGDALTKWLLGQAVLMLFVGAATAIGLAALGVPLALSIGAIAGALEFVPYFGAIASGVLAVLLAFVQGPTQALYVAILCLAIQQIEGNLLVPLVQRWSVKLAPVLSILAALIFGVLFGPLGVLFATPLMLVVIVLVQKLYIEGVLEAKPLSTLPADA